MIALIPETTLGQDRATQRPHSTSAAESESAQRNPCEPEYHGARTRRLSFGSFALPAVSNRLSTFYEADQARACYAGRLRSDSSLRVIATVRSCASPGNPNIRCCIAVTGISPTPRRAGPDRGPGGRSAWTVSARACSNLGVSHLGVECVAWRAGPGPLPAPGPRGPGPKGSKWFKFRPAPGPQPAWTATSPP